MKSNSFRLLFAAALLAASALTAHASVDSTLIINLVGYFQNSSNLNGNIENGKVKTVRIGAKDLIRMISRDARINFRGGSKLMIGTDGAVYVTTPDGKIRTDVSAYVKCSVLGEAAVHDGSLNLVTGQENRRNYYPITLTFNFLDLHGSATGMASEKILVSKPDKDGVQIANGLIKASVSGAATNDLKNGYLEGTLLLKGREAVIR
jgi:hypothetical protein